MIPYDPLLITCAEGLRETEHPLTFVARTAFGQLLDSPGAAEKALPLTGRLVAPLRAALSSEDAGAVAGGLTAVRQLSAVVGPALDEYLHVLLIPVGSGEGSRCLLNQLANPSSAPLGVLACLTHSRPLASLLGVPRISPHAY